MYILPHKEHLKRKALLSKQRMKGTAGIEAQIEAQQQRAKSAPRGSGSRGGSQYYTGGSSNVPQTWIPSEHSALGGGMGINPETQEALRQRLAYYDQVRR